MTEYTRKTVLLRLAEQWKDARYELRPINRGNGQGVFDRKANAFIAIGAIPNIDPEEIWAGEAA